MGQTEEVKMNVRQFTEQSLELLRMSVLNG